MSYLIGKSIISSEWTLEALRFLRSTHTFGFSITNIVSFSDYTPSVEISLFLLFGQVFFFVYVALISFILKFTVFFALISFIGKNFFLRFALISNTLIYTSVNFL